MFLGFSLGSSWAFLLILSYAVCRPPPKTDDTQPDAWRPRTQFQPVIQSDRQRRNSPLFPPSKGYAPTGPGSVNKPQQPKVPGQSGVYVGPGSWVPGPAKQSWADPSGSSNVWLYNAAPYPFFAEAYFSPFMVGETQSAPSEGSRMGPPSANAYPFQGRDPDLFMASQFEPAPGGFPDIGPAPAVQFLFPDNPAPHSPDRDAIAPLPPVPPPSRIIQSSNGFMRVTHQRSRAKYSPDSLDSTDGADPLTFLSASDPRGDQKV